MKKMKWNEKDEMEEYWKKKKRNAKELQEKEMLESKEISADTGP